MTMAFLDQADDWLTVGICQVGGGVFFAGGMWLFQFQSYNAGQYSAFFVYAGLGLGAGGSIGGISLPDMLSNGPPDASKMAWSTLSCDSAFSANDLNWAAGRVSSGSLAAVVGYSDLAISAGKFPSTSLFQSQDCSGWGTGVGINAVTTVGVWKYVQDANYQVIW
jgi:hypothetical protein